MIRRPLVVLLLLIPAISPSSRACTCSDAPPGTCPGIQKDDVVFLGTVTAVEDIAYAAPHSPDSSDPPSDPPAKQSAPVDIVAARLTRYHFHIDESFALAGTGQSDAEIDVFSGGDDGDCAYRFKQGQQYVVFTHPGTDNHLYATICSGTRPAAEARALLPQLRAMRSGQRVASVFGVLRRSEPPFLALPDDPDEPLKNISLKLRSSDDRFETSSDSEGVYSFYDVHAGTYNFTARLPVRMELTRKSLTGGLPPFKIPNGACYEYDVDALPTGHMRGSVLGPGGKPLPLASIELYRAGTYDPERPGLWGFQGAEGVFDLDHIGPGEYILVFNRADRMDPNAPFRRTFYPGAADIADAQPIKLKDGQQLLKLNMQLTDGYPTHALRVKLEWQGARPPGNVTVMAKADQGENPSAQKIDDGAYQFTLLNSASYTISAWEDLTPRRGAGGAGRADCAVPDRIDAAPITVAASDDSAKEITLTLINPPCDKDAK
jgi:hypothetical protein